MSAATRVVDPIRFEVIRSALVAATEEMALTLRRSGYSTNIKTRADFSCILFDERLRAVAQGFSQPVHLGSLIDLVPEAIRQFGVERLRRGDMLITNHPFLGGVHLNDVTVIAPIFFEGEPLGYVANLAHHVDVGGGAPASIGAFKEIYQEGVIIPPVRLVSEGKVVDDVFRLIIEQIRSRRETSGDLRAQIAANVTGVRRVTRLVEDYGVEELRRYVQELLDYTDRRTKAEIESLPGGVYRAEGSLDSDGVSGEIVPLVATVLIRDGSVSFDFTGCPAQRRAPINSTRAVTFAACAFVLKCLIDPDIPINDGFYRHIDVNASVGTIVNARQPAPVVAGYETGMRLTDVMLASLSEGLPERVPAGTKAMVCHAGFGGYDSERRELFAFLETIAGGYGGRAGLDGPDAVQTHGQNTENAPVEETERDYPVRIARYELVDDSGGPGEFRGGLGVRRDYHFDQEASFTVLADREKHGPAGAFGGLPGRPAAYVLIRDGREERLPSKTTIEVRPGDTISYRTCGGGGYGPPHRRRPDLVRMDVLQGKVSLESAATNYLVALHGAVLEVDEAETQRLRSAATSVDGSTPP